MRSLCFSPRTSSFRESVSSPSITSLSSDSDRQQTINAAAAIIMKWDAETSSYARVTSLFHETKTEAMQFIGSVNDLHKIMHSLVADQDLGSESLLNEAQRLMQIAIKRLQKEFYQLLSMNRAHLDPESVSTRSSLTSAQSSLSSDYGGSPDVADSISEVEQVSFTVMSDLKLIADCMIGSGYAKECVQVYNIIRKSIIDEGIYKLGIEKLSSSQMNKMEWDELSLKITDWLEAIKVSMTTLFSGERILCDYIFSSSDSIRESCFSEITKEGAIALFRFPELVAKAKKSPSHKIFRLLDMYTAISDHWQEIETIFSFYSTSAVRSQALDSMDRLSGSVRSLLSDFESTIQKDSSKSKIPSCGALHPLTISSMNYLTLLADYSNILIDIIPGQQLPVKSSSPGSCFHSPVSVESPASIISVLMRRLVLVLLCKLDGKAKHYKDDVLSYIFLANNLRYVISRVHKSNLHYLLGEEWIAEHEVKVNLFVENYKRLAGGNIFASLPKENQKAPIRQISCVVPDSKLRGRSRSLLEESSSPFTRSSSIP